MKPLYPTHRENRRYLLVKGKNISGDIIERSILEFIGVLGYAEASPKFITRGKNEMILSIQRKSLDKVRSSLLVSPHTIAIVKVSGSLKSLSKSVS